MPLIRLPPSTGWGWVGPRRMVKTRNKLASARKPANPNTHRPQPQGARRQHDTSATSSCFLVGSYLPLLTTSRSKQHTKVTKHNNNHNNHNSKGGRANWDPTRAPSSSGPLVAPCGGGRPMPQEVGGGMGDKQLQDDKDTKPAFYEMTQPSATPQHGPPKKTRQHATSTT